MNDDDLIRRGDALAAIKDLSVYCCGAHEIIAHCVSAALPAQGVRVKPTDAQVASACLSYRHDFGLLSEEERKKIMFQAREWLHAWQKELAALEPAEAGGVEAVTKDAQAFDDMSRVADDWMNKYDDAKQDRDDAMALANEAIRQLQAAKSELRNVEFGLADPVAVHINMLRGTIAKPTVEQIIHLYGVDALVKALAPVIVREAEAEHDEYERKVAQMREDFPNGI